MDGSKRFRVNEPRVLCQQFDQEVAVVHLATGHYHSLSGVAGEAFLILGSAGASRDDVAAELLARYDVSREIIEQDLSVFLEELQSQRLIVPAREGAPRVLKTTESGARAAYAAPKIETFKDLQELFLLDPVHDVDAAGWPNAASADIVEERREEAGLSRFTRCRLAGPNIIFERFDDETVAINVGTGSYHSLNGEAEDIFLLFPYDPTIGEIRAALLAKYAVEEAELESALRAYLDDLAAAGLIVLDPGDANQTPDRVLTLSRGGSGVSFSQPVLGVFGQPSFDKFSGTEQSFLEPAMEYDPARKVRYAVRPGDFILSESGGEMVICDRDAGHYFKLNAPATEAFRALLRGSVSDAARVLQQRYQVTQQELRTAVMGLLWNLRQLRLLVLTQDESPASPDVAAADQAPIAFPGFHVAIYRDMEELMRPFNPAPAGGPKHRDMVRHQRLFTEMLGEYFAESAAAGESEGVYAVGGHTLRIRCAGEAPAQLRRAFDHLAIAPTSTADLTIHVWNGASLAPGPLLAGPLERLRENWSKVCGSRGELVDFHSGAVSAIFHPGPDVLSVLDLERSHAYYLVRNSAPLPFWELGSPFRHILHAWFATRGLQFTHVAAVGDGSRQGVLLAGKGGSGKSTTALLCAAAGLSYVGDDYCVIDTREGRVLSLYNTAKLKSAEDLARVPDMRDRSCNSDSFERGGSGKGVFLLSDVWPERMTGGFPLRAILLPMITSNSATSLAPCTPSEALLALAPSTVAQLPGSAQSDADRLVALTEKIPAHKLLLGSDLAAIPDMVRRVLE